jgi:hypothetical protein
MFQNRKMRKQILTHSHPIRVHCTYSTQSDWTKSVKIINLYSKLYCGRLKSESALIAIIWLVGCSMLRNCLKTAWRENSYFAATKHKTNVLLTRRSQNLGNKILHECGMPGYECLKLTKQRMCAFYVQKKSVCLRMKFNWNTGDNRRDDPRDANHKGMPPPLKGCHL